MKCPQCGYEDPFHPSWYVPWKEIAEPCYFEEWNPSFWILLEDLEGILLEDLEVCKQEGDVTYEGYVYHRTPTSVERMDLKLSIEYHVKGFPPQERSHRKNYHLLGKQLMSKQERMKAT